VGCRGGGADDLLLSIEEVRGGSKAAGAPPRLWVVVRQRIGPEGSGRNQRKDVMGEGGAGGGT
jgi:hypothetical protein